MVGIYSWKWLSDSPQFINVHDMAGIAVKVLASHRSVLRMSSCYQLPSRCFQLLVVNAGTR